MSTPFGEPMDEIERLRRERDYYKHHADELAGEAVKRDYTISTLRHALKQKTQGFALLAELQHYIGEGQNLREIFEYTTHRINAMLGMDKSVVLVPDAPPDRYKPDSWSGFENGLNAALPELQIEIPHSWVRRGSAILASSAAPMTPLSRRLQETFALPYFILLPVLVSGEPIGLLLAGRQREQKPFAPPLDEGDVDTLQSIATLIAAFVHARQLAALKEDNAMLRHLATVDKLTGIANRRRFEEVLQQEWARAARRGSSISLFLLDVDHFKKCNDTYGHDVGDIILKQVAERITQGLRPGDMGARYGGEEFAVVLPDTTGAGAEAVAERVRQRIAATPMPHGITAKSSHVTASIGVATAVPQIGGAPAALVSLADKALYRAKRGGRDRVETMGI